MWYNSIVEEPQGGKATGSDSLHPPAISPAYPAGEYAHTARVRTAQVNLPFLMPAATVAGNTPPRLHEAAAATKKTARKDGQFPNSCPCCCNSLAGAVRLQAMPPGSRPAATSQPENKPIVIVTRRRATAHSPEREGGGCTPTDRESRKAAYMRIKKQDQQKRGETLLLLYISWYIVLFCSMPA